MGNITALSRYHGNASVKTNELIYSYTGNRINQKVETYNYPSLLLGDFAVENLPDINTNFDAVALILISNI